MLRRAFGSLVIRTVKKIHPDCSDLTDGPDVRWRPLVEGLRVWSIRLIRSIHKSVHPLHTSEQTDCPWRSNLENSMLAISPLGPRSAVGPEHDYPIVVSCDRIQIALPRSQPLNIPRLPGHEKPALRGWLR